MDYSKYVALSIEVRDGVAQITMLFQGDDIATRDIQHGELADIWGVLERDSDVRSVLLTGGGDEFYLSGAPSGPHPPLTDEQLRRITLPDLLNGEVNRLIRGMINFEKPVVAAINGPAAGAGVCVALLSDISIMADDAWLVDAHVLSGVSAGDGPGGIWPLYTGLAKAKLYLMTSDAIVGTEAERIGLVARSVPRAQLMDVANDYATRLAAAPPVAMRYTKRGINQWLRLAELVSQTQASALEALSFWTGEVSAGPYYEWPPRQVP